MSWHYREFPIAEKGIMRQAVEHVLELQMRNDSSICRMIPLPIGVMIT